MTAATGHDREQLVAELASAWSSGLALVDPQKLTKILSYSFLDIVGRDMNERLLEFARVCGQIIINEMIADGFTADANLAAMLLGLGEYRDKPRSVRYQIAGQYAKTLPRADLRNTGVTDEEYYIAYVRKIDGKDAMRRLLVYLEAYDTDSEREIEKAWFVAKYLYPYDPWGGGQWACSAPTRETHPPEYYQKYARKKSANEKNKGEGQGNQ
jgi:hypothetical protein